MRRSSEALSQVLEQIEFVRSVLEGRERELKEKVRGGRYSRGVLEEVKEIAEVLDRYLNLLVKLKKEFGVVFEVGDEMERELVWEFRAIDDVERKRKVIEFVRKVRKGEVQ